MLIHHLPLLIHATLPPKPPLFSWDTVPVFMHSFFEPLSSNDSAFYARFPLVTMAGYAGSGKCCNTANVPGPGLNISCCNEGKITSFAREIKAKDATTRVLYYQNSLINFPQTVLGSLTAPTIPKDFLLHDKRGRLVYLGGCGSTHAAPNHTIYDHSQAAMRAAWTGNIVDVVKANPGLLDGVFADRGGSISAVLTKDLHCYTFTKEDIAAWDTGHFQAIADTQRALDLLLDTAIVVGNHAERVSSMKLSPKNSTWAAKMYEHFTPIKTKDYIPLGNQLDVFRKDAHYDGGLIDEIHVDFCTVSATNSMYARSLAAFLIGAR